MNDSRRKSAQPRHRERSAAISAEIASSLAMTESAMKNVTPFAKQIYAIVKRIPKGETRTYKEVAVLAGRPRAFRAVGNILNKNRDKEVPCHRVVRSDGHTGGYAWGGEKKKRILKREGAL